VVNGDNDVIIYTINSYILQQNIPNAQLILYPDANHGSQYQYPERFVRHVSDLLSEDVDIEQSFNHSGTILHDHQD